METRFEPQRCVLCLRSKEEAINEQVEKGVGCGSPNCIFAQSIKEAIEYSKSSLRVNYCIKCGYKFQNGDKFCVICGNKRG